MLPSKQLLCIKERQLYYCKKKVAANTETKMLCKFFPNNSILHTEGMIFAKSLLPIEEQSDHYTDYSRFLVASSLTKSLAATPYPNDLFYLQFGKSDLKFYYLTLPYTNSKSYLEKTLPHKYSLKHIRTKYVQTAARIFHPMSGQEIMHSRCRTSTNKP